MGDMILYVFYKYMHYFLGTDNIQCIKEILSYLLMLLWLVFVNPSLPQHLESLSVFLIVFLLTWQYEASFFKKLSLTLFIYASYVLCEMLIGYLLMVFDPNMRSDTFLTVKAIIILFVMYLWERTAELAGEQIKKMQLAAAESESAKRQLAGYSNQMDVMKNSQEKVRGLRHDLKHHLNELMLLAEREDADEIKKYIRRMDDFMTYSKEYVSSGNADIDSLLNLMLDNAKKELGDVSCKVRIPKELSIEPFDLNVILGNLLDNAILAAKQTPEKYLKVRISYKTGMLFIHIENSYAGALVKEGKRYISTKEDNTAVHGMGIINVQSIVEKYNGDMEIKDEKQIFQVRIVLYVSGESERISP